MLTKVSEVSHFERLHSFYDMNTPTKADRIEGYLISKFSHSILIERKRIKKNMLGFTIFIILSVISYNIADNEIAQKLTLLLCVIVSLSQFYSWFKRETIIIDYATKRIKHDFEFFTYKYSKNTADFDKFNLILILSEPNSESIGSHYVNVIEEKMAC